MIPPAEPFSVTFSTMKKAVVFVIRIQFPAFPIMLQPEIKYGFETVPFPPVTPLGAVKLESLLMVIGLWGTWLPARTLGLKRRTPVEIINSPSKREALFLCRTTNVENEPITIWAAGNDS